MPLRILQEKDFVGRTEELEFLRQRALDAEKGNAQSLFLAGDSGIGKTELVKQLFNYLFWKQGRTVPFYYSVNNAVLSAKDFSRDYLSKFICQRLALENKEASLINLEGISIEDLISLSERKKAGWAIEILKRYAGCSEAIDFVRIALGAPMAAVRSTGVPAVVMIDEFQRLKNLHHSNEKKPELVELFETVLSHGKTFHIITGSKPEIQEMPVIGSLAQFAVKPLQLDSATLVFSNKLNEYNVRPGPIPQTVLTNLGGNPFYIQCVARAAALGRVSDTVDCLKAYTGEITSGVICRRWESALKSRFPLQDKRRKAIEIINCIYNAGEGISPDRVASAVSIRESQAEEIITGLYMAGFADYEFGMLKRPKDKVVADFAESLYSREISGSPSWESEKKLEGSLSSSKEEKTSYEMTIPMQKEAELIVANCLEQIGKNLHLDQETIGRLQLAVIEACINAIEHSESSDKKIYLGFDIYPDHIEIGIENSGREFVSPETGEPFSNRSLQEKSGRGWGIKLMKNFADDVRFEKTARGSKVVLVKKLSKTIKGEVKTSGE